MSSLTNITAREQRLCQILVQCAMMIHDPTINWFKGKSFNEVGNWIRHQLNQLDFESTEMGSLHVYLTKYTGDL